MTDKSSAWTVDSGPTGGGVRVMWTVVHGEYAGVIVVATTGVYLALKENLCYSFADAEPLSCWHNHCTALYVAPIPIRQIDGAECSEVCGVCFSLPVSLFF